MPTPLSPSSSQEIIPISPPAHLRQKRKTRSEEGSTSIPLPAPVRFDRELEDRLSKRLKEQQRKEESQNGEDKADRKTRDGKRERMKGMSRTQVTSRMVSSMACTIDLAL